MGYEFVKNTCSAAREGERVHGEVEEQRRGRLWGLLRKGKMDK